MRPYAEVVPPQRKRNRGDEGCCMMTSSSRDEFFLMRPFGRCEKDCNVGGEGASERGGMPVMKQPPPKNGNGRDTRRDKRHLVTQEGHTHSSAQANPVVIAQWWGQRYQYFHIHEFDSHAVSQFPPSEGSSFVRGRDASLGSKLLPKTKQGMQSRCAAGVRFPKRTGSTPARAYWQHHRNAASADGLPKSLVPFPLMRV